jgi:hypothetical protein
MDSQVLRDARLQEPFRPFSIRMNDGRILPVLQPESVAVGPNIVILVTESDSVIVLDPPSIESLVYKPNGRNDAKRRRKS